MAGRPKQVNKKRIELRIDSDIVRIVDELGGALQIQGLPAGATKRTAIFEALVLLAVGEFACNESTDYNDVYTPYYLTKILDGITTGVVFVNAHRGAIIDAMSGHTPQQPAE